MLGYNSVEEIIGEDILSKHITPESLKKVREAHASGYEGMYEVVGIKNDGTHFPVEIVTKSISYKGKPVRVAASRDITERKKAADALRKSEKRYRSIIELSPLGMGMMNSEGVIVDTNQALASMLGYDVKDLIGMNFGEITHPDDFYKELELLQPVWDDEEISYTLEKRYRHKDGHYFWVTITVAKMIGYSEDEAYVFGFIADITERKQMELEREKLITELREAFKEIKELRGFLPICVNCKKIRDDEGYWQQVEKYIMDRTHAQFSHGICPDCMKKLYPDFYKD